MTTLSLQDMRAWLERLARIFEQEMDQLSQLDGALGDQELWDQHGARLRAISAKLAAGPAAADIGALLQTAGMSILSATGGATGPLFATIFLEAARLAKGKTELTVKDIAAMLQAASSGVAAVWRNQSGRKDHARCPCPGRQGRCVLPQTRDKTFQLRWRKQHEPLRTAPRPPSRCSPPRAGR